MTGGVRWAEFGPDLLRLDPAPGSARVAARAALTMLVVLSALFSVGHLSWALYATFGGFASVYGGRFPWRGRWRVQTALGLLLTAAVTTGVLTGLSPHRAWLSVPVAALWAGTAAILSDRFGWRPPGPLFAVFAVSACAAVPTAAADVVPAIGVAAGTAALAVALGVAEGRWSGGRAGMLFERPPAPPAHPIHRQRMQAVRCVAAVAVAGGLATASGIGHPYWAMVAAVVPLTVATLHAQLLRAAHRTVGTLVGLALAAALLVVPLPGPALILVVVALQGGAELLVGRNYGAALLCITCLALLLGQLAAPQPLGTLLLERLLQTLLGVAVGLAAAVVTRHVPAGTPRRGSGSGQ